MNTSPHLTRRVAASAALLAVCAGCGATEVSSRVESPAPSAAADPAAATTPASETPVAVEATAAPPPATETPSAAPSSVGEESAAALSAVLSSAVEMRVEADLIGLDAAGRQQWGLPQAVRSAIPGEAVAATDGVLRWYTHGAARDDQAVAVPEGVVPMAISADGNTVALSEPAPAGEWAKGAIGPGRQRSTIVLADRRHPDLVKSWELAGNFVPEALANLWVEGSGGIPASVFLLEYTPAEAPTHYRVRVLDTTSGEIGLPLNLRDKSQTVDESMAGLSRNQVMAPSDGLLFTLYRSNGAEEYSFVHTLGLINGVWCIDLPRESEITRSGGALALSPDERTLYVVGANGWLGEISTDVQQGLTVNRSVQLDLHGSRSLGPALTVSNDSVYIGMGDEVLRVDRKTLASASTTALAGPITSLTVDRADRRLLVGTLASIHELTGDLQAVADVGHGHAGLAVTELTPV